MAYGLSAFKAFLSLAPEMALYFQGSTSGTREDVKMNDHLQKALLK